MKTKLWFVKEKGAARQYSRLPSSRRPEKTDMVWIPISQIEHATREPAAAGEEYPAHILTVTDWFGRKENL